jgi:hypothetical protein
MEQSKYFSAKLIRHMHIANCQETHADLFTRNPEEPNVIMGFRARLTGNGTNVQIKQSGVKMERWQSASVEQLKIETRMCFF